ncbi:MAG: 3-deoxy-manno-octulosonate cytidylyltransferase [SAR324 cluster bacterium]|nr:3-deoxy-manno-octulosonate cytidylyltransferase [SAR324 cluster bacterium]
MTFHNVAAIIPARYASTRFPGKPLVKIMGLPMIQRVYQQVTQSGIEKVMVATDDERIARVVKDFGGEVIMTNPNHSTGTDRLAEAAQQLSCEWILNVQGDEPVISPDDLNNLVETTMATGECPISTLIFPITEETHFNNPNVVKVVLNQNNHALYFSRAAIPFPRNPPQSMWKHLGIYFYRKDFLLAFSQWPQAQLESTESLEQLRILERGYPILCVPAKFEGIGVDHPDDILKVERFLMNNSPKTKETPA